MLEIASPTDVLVSTLIWIGVPALVLFPFVLALGIAEWIRAGAWTVRTVQQGSDVLRGYRDEVVGRLGYRLLSLISVQALLVAGVYSIFRLVYATGIDDASGYSIADGRSFRWSELWLNLIMYSGESQLAVNAALFTLGWVLGVDAAVVFRRNMVLELLALVRWPVLVIGGLGAVGIGVVGLAVLSLATWLNDPSYQVEMVSLYACWVMLLLLVTVTVFSSVSRAQETLAPNRTR
ncbi:hypothetical protein [Kocuria marina]|uniref:hypothetical protein n=1 Tax=Kocuria marina TaxID=223184 RepID=UPI00345FA25D